MNVFFIHAIISLSNQCMCFITVEKICRLMTNLGNHDLVGNPQQKLNLSNFNFMFASISH